MNGLHPALPAAVSGERFEFDSPAGRLSCYVAGSGAPLLLVHSVNAAASVAEVRPMFEQYRATRTVYAIDLPGYGFSDRSDRLYTPRLMTDALRAVVAQIQARHGKAPIDALAVSLACEFLARAALEIPASFRRVALVSPTGFSGSKRRRGAPGSTLYLAGLHSVLKGPGPGWGGALFRGLTRPGVIRFFLRKTWGSRDIDEALWAYDVITTRQPGAEHAPLCFLSVAMFSKDINDIYEKLALPVWMSHGVRGDFTDYRGKSTVAGRPNWTITVFQSGAMPYFDQSQAFQTAFDAFLAA